MRALHISAFSGSLYLWCEGAGNDSLKGLKSSLKSIGFKIKVLKSNTGEITVWLPSRQKTPIPSSPLMGKITDGGRKTSLYPFKTAARMLVFEEALELCSIAREGNIAGSGVIFGDSLDWTGSLLRTVIRLVAEERFLPGLFQKQGIWEARWAPVIGNELEHRIQKLSGSMPPVLGCMGKGEKPPDMPSRLSVNMLLSKCLDQAVRESICGMEGSRGHDSLHDEWLNALAGRDGAVRWDDRRQLHKLSEELANWSRPIDIMAGSAFKLCFRLSEPEEDIYWRVDYLLQPAADQSIYFPVSKLWEDGSREAEQLKRFGEKPVEFVLAALGQASGLCGYIKKSLMNKKPRGFKLDANGAFAFLKEYSRALKSSGFGVLLPSWWVGEGPAKKIGVKVKAGNGQMQGSSGLTLDSMIEFDYRASLGDEELTLEELMSLAAMKAPLVKIRGQWTQIDSEKIANIIDMLKKKEARKLALRDLLPAVLGSGDKVNGISIDSVDTGGWLKELTEKLSAKSGFDIIAQPEGFNGMLRPYQERGYSWFSFLNRWGIGACLADDMGLGKTIQSLAFILKQKKEGRKGPLLVVCPTTVVNNWLKEAEAFTPGLKVLVHHGSGRKRMERFLEAAKSHDIIISSYGLLHQDIDFLKKIKWAGLIMDEAQNIKNPETKRSRAARSLESACRIALTGTPVENHVGDLWSIMEFLNPGLLGSREYFKNKFFRPIQLYGDEEAAARLRSAAGPFILRRMKTDRDIISDLPEKMEIKDYCSLTKEQASLYRAAVDDMQKQIEEAEGINRRGLVLSVIMKLKQICNHPAQFAGDNSSAGGRSGKLQRLEEMLEETLELGERTLVFTQFARMGKILQKHLQDHFAREVFLLTGVLDKKKRDSMVDCFQNDDSAPHIFILSLKAGGTGLNLTRANNVIHYDRWWNPAVEDQATDRAYRIGQKKNVAVHKFIVAGTLEERIDEMIEKKTGIAGKVIGTGEKWLTELSNEDFFEVIKLGSEAMGD
jgi:superfamily II DNA or RNA helicase